MHVVGSFLLRTHLDLDANVDVAVTLPSALFSPKDRLNLKYHRKVALYLARLAAVLRATPAFASVQFACAQGDALRPCLVVRPARSSGKPAKFVLRIFPAVEPGTFEVPSGWRGACLGSVAH